MKTDQLLAFFSQVLPFYPWRSWLAIRLWMQRALQQRCQLLARNTAISAGERWKGFFLVTPDMRHSQGTKWIQGPFYRINELALPGGQRRQIIQSGIERTTGRTPL